MKILRELGADVGQGYFFAKPLAVEDALMLTTMDPLPVFPLTDLDDADERRTTGRRRTTTATTTSGDGASPSGPGIAAEVMGALDAVEHDADVEARCRATRRLSDDMHIERRRVARGQARPPVGVPQGPLVLT